MYVCMCFIAHDLAPPFFLLYMDGHISEADLDFFLWDGWICGREGGTKGKSCVRGRSVSVDM